MSTTKTGGSAFPVQESEVMNNGERAQYAEPGMTLLDHFAGLAMAAWWSDGSGGAYPGPCLTDKEEYARQVEVWREGLRKASAEWSYAMAAAMIAERERIMKSE